MRKAAIFLGEYKSIEDYRRKKRFGRFFKKFLLIIVIAVILIVLLNVLELFKGTKLEEIIGSKSGTESVKDFPLYIKNEQMVDFATFNNNIAVLSKANVFVYNNNGKKVNSFMHGYTNPVIKESTKRILTYDRGGNKLRVDTANSSIGSVQLKFPILTAQISTNGSVAVVTSSDRYPCEVQVYDNSLKNMIYRYYSTEEFSIVDFSMDEQSLFCGAISTREGILSCNIYNLGMNDTEIKEVTLVKDILPLAIFENDGNKLKIVGKDSIVTINQKDQTQERYDYKGGLQSFVNSSINETILINKNLLTSYSTITVVGADGKPLATMNIDDDVIDVYSDGSRISVLCKSNLYNYDMSLAELDNIRLTKSMNKIVYNGSNIYILGADSIEKYDMD